MRSALRVLFGLVVVAAPAVAQPVASAPPAGPHLVHLGGATTSGKAGGTIGTVVETYTFLFPITAVGDTSTSTCFWVNFGNPGGSASGHITQDMLPSSPFQVSNFRVVDLASSDNCTGTPATFPATINPGQAYAFDASFTPRQAGNFAGTYLHSTEAGIEIAWEFFGSTITATCVSSNTTMCLSYGRFAVSANWTESNGTSGAAQMVPLTQDTGSMWFFSADNIEAEVKLIDGCGLNSHYWFFAGGLTNVKVVITVTDTATGQSKTYRNPQSTAFLPIQDTSAFSTCP
jgi:hypothetical protein